VPLRLGSEQTATATLSLALMLPPTPQHRPDNYRSLLPLSIPLPGYAAHRPGTTTRGHESRVGRVTGVTPTLISGELAIVVGLHPPVTDVSCANQPIPSATLRLLRKNNSSPNEYN
jgi:hypothetical protein